ncbi:glycoside hydrolase family 88 protein [Paenibacillus sp. FSL H8-0048]|uniref:glycoside hydrolase family 88/105 protein n=1 Tax=Paenibacillus sp. FSL H8-0048 TaxID=2954508 RepID=UPI0030F941CF
MTNEILLDKIGLVVDRLMNLGGSDYEKDKTVVQAETRVGIVQRDFGIEEWDWPQGVGLYGLYKLQKHYGDTRYLEFFRNWVSRNLEAGLPSKNINTTAPYLPLVLLLEQLEPSGELEELCREHADWLIHELPKTKEGGFQHTVTAIGNRDGIHLHNGQLWIDTLFMAVLFLNQAGRKFNRPEWGQEAEHQILLHIKYLFDKHTGLFFHGWSFERNDNFGSIFWCRGNSWFTYGIADYLEACQDSISPGVRRFLIDTYTAQVNALVSLQAASGLWHTVLQDPTSYEEVSGSAAIAAGIIKGIKTGILDSSYQAAADKAIQAVCQNISADGTVLNVSAGTGMGMDKEHYKNIALRPMAYGQSLALIALYEALK